MDELIDALRHCSNEAIEMCPPCKYFAWDKPKDDCKFEMMRDAAAALERLMAEVDRKDKALQDWVNTWEQTKDKLIDRICANCDTPPETRLRLCGDCPIISPIREVFNGV